ncbi:MAG: sulfatase-like hydrolase/transferase, partial [Halobacteriaceae archaeon]
MISILKPYLRPPYFWYLSKRADIRQTASDIQVTTLPSSPDHILLICIDALRQDAVPSLPEVEFSQAIAPSTWTFPSVTSTLTGKYPHEHGAVAHTMPEDESFALPEQAEPDQSLPQLFEAAGYDTAGIFGFPMPFMATRGWFQSHRVWADEPA